MSDISLVGERLAKARLRFPGLSARELSRLAGLGFGHVANIEAGNGGPPQIDTIQKVASVLGACPAWLAFGVGKEPSQKTVVLAVTAAKAKALGKTA